MRVLSTVLLSAALAVAAAVAVPAAASAATNPYTPERVCGSGFHQIDRQGVNGGVVYLLYNAGNGQNCVTTIKTAGVGTATSTSARLEVRGDSHVYRDSGRFKYYAGPVKHRAAHTCVRWGGSTYLAGYLSPFEHCG